MTEKDAHAKHCFRHGQNHPCERCMDEALEGVTARKVPCRKCGLTDEMCLCVAKAYIADLEAKIEKLEDDDKPPVDALIAFVKKHAYKADSAGPTALAIATAPTVAPSSTPTRSTSPAAWSRS